MADIDTINRARRALDSDLDAIAALAARILGGDVVFDGGGDPAGVTYRDGGTRRYYAADLDDCRRLLEMYAELASVPEEERRTGDVYSLWCAATTASEHETEDGAAAELTEGVGHGA